MGTRYLRVPWILDLSGSLIIERVSFRPSRIRVPVQIPKSQTAISFARSDHARIPDLLMKTNSCAKCID